LPLVRNQDEIPGPSEKPSGRQWYRDRHTLSQTYPSTSTLQAEVRICGRGVPAERVALKRGLELTNVPDPRRERSGPGVRRSEEISSSLVPEPFQISIFFEICREIVVYFFLNREADTIIEGNRLPEPTKTNNWTPNSHT